MITIAMSTVIGADREAVWRSLTAPQEILRWDEHMRELLDPAQSHPREGQTLRWRYQLGSVTVVLSDRPLEVSPPELLRSSLSLGLFRFCATHTLGVEAAEPARTKLAVKLVAENHIPVVGGALDRFDVRRIGAQFVDDRLRALQKWCENPVHPPADPRADQMCSSSTTQRAGSAKRERARGPRSNSS